MSDFNKNGEHANDMDYIIELQESISWMEKMCGNTNSALAVYRTYLERNGYGVQLLDIDKELQCLDIEPPKFHLIAAAPDMYEALKELSELFPEDSWEELDASDFKDRSDRIMDIVWDSRPTLAKAEGK